MTETMTIERLHDLFDQYSDKTVLEWIGHCHDCGCDVWVEALPTPEGIAIKGGAVYEPEAEQFFLKCDACFSKNKTLRNYQVCEVYSRIVGYYAPVFHTWNPGKRVEFKDRKTFDGSLK